jgi:RpiB/LacA/LacB family sugar-phosphate isomerase
MTRERIALGADHRGVALKRRVLDHLKARGLPAEDLGTMSTESCDYPEIAHDVASRVDDGSVDRGILICGSGIGMAMAANKHAGVRAALCNDLEAAEMSRRHNDANVLCLAADRLDGWPDEKVGQLLDVWLDTPFEGGRHQRRVEKIAIAADSPSRR